MRSRVHATLRTVTLFDPDPEIDPDPEPAEPVTWTVPQLNQHLAEAISRAVPASIWVEGEIINLNRSSAGHVYFSLIEPGTDRRDAPSTLSVSLFKGNKERVNLQLTRAGGGLRMDDGVRVRIRGTVELYVKRGQVQLKMQAIDPEFTLGDLAVRREALLRQLADEGLLNANGTIALPMIPLRIGLVTSVGSAAHADFIAELEASGFGFEIVSVDARVQGVDAESTIVAAIRTLGRVGVDVIALVRGGGARTDLAAFDSEAIARSVASSPVPVWSGIGHEIDQSVADEVSHTTWKTPTACAAGIVARVRAGRDALQGRWTAVIERANDRSEGERRRLDANRRGIAAISRTRLARGDAQVASIRQQIRREARHHLETSDRRVSTCAAAIAHASDHRLTTAAHRVDLAFARVGASDPTRLIARGWSITHRADGRPVRSIDELVAGDELITRLADGSVRSTVTMTKSIGDHR